MISNAKGQDELRKIYDTGYRKNMHRKVAKTKEEQLARQIDKPDGALARWAIHNNGQA